MGLAVGAVSLASLHLAMVSLDAAAGLIDAILLAGGAWLAVPRRKQSVT